MVTAWKYTQDPQAENAVMFIDKHIGFDEEEGQGIIGSDFKRELLELDSMGKKSIRVEINSPGGTVTEAMDIYHAILTANTKVDTYCYGLAASSAGLIFQAGRNRIMADNGILMYHRPYDSTDPDNKKPDPALEAIAEACVTMVESRTGLSRDEVNKIMQKQATFLSPQQAIDMKMADKIEDSGDKNKKRSTATDVKAIWKDYQKYSNKIINELTTPDMKKICAKLGLNPDATEESCIAEIDRIVNKKQADMDDLDDKIKALKKDLQTSTEDCTAKAKDLKDLEDKYTALKKKDDDEEMDKKKAKGKVLVDSAVKLGKITSKAETMQDWVDKYVADETGTTKLLEGLGVNVKAPEITNLDTIVDTANLSEEEKEIVKWEEKMAIADPKNPKKYGSAEWINFKNMQKLRDGQSKFKV